MKDRKLNMNKKHKVQRKEVLKKSLFMYESQIGIKMKEIKLRMLITI